MIDPQPCDGALNLLRACVGVRPGGRLLLVREPPGAGYYDEDAPRMAAEAACAQGFEVTTCIAPPGLDDAELAAFANGLGVYDHVLYFSRIGDQLRFAPAGRTPATMVYALDGAALSGEFGGACHLGLMALKAIVEQAFDAAGHVRVTCPRGTDYAGRLPRSALPPPETTINRFPMLVHRPVPADEFNGRVVLSRFLIGCGSRFYEPYWRVIPQDVVAHVEGNRLVALDGPPESCAAIRAHYAYVAGLFDVDPWFVHSWHAGIHPACVFNGAAEDAPLRWSGAAFGSPRILHFHTCGAYAPGEISWTLLDATVALDGVAVWDHGRLHPERLAGGAEWAAAHPKLAAIFERPVQAVGL